MLRHICSGLFLRMFILLAVAIVIAAWPDSVGRQGFLPKRRVVMKKIIRKPETTLSALQPKKRTHHIRLKPLIVIQHQPDSKAEDAPPLIQQYVVGESNERRPIECLVFGEGEDGILVMATIHGDEIAGTLLVRQLERHLRAHPKLLAGRRVMLLPVVNPDGRERNSRYNANGVDLNRNFKTVNRQNSRRHGFFALSEPETRAIVRAIRQCDPNRVITLHQPLACIDYDGPGRDLAQHIATCCNLPVRKLGAMPGSLGSYAGIELGIPTITLELPGEVERLGPRYLWDQYGNALIASVMYPTFVDVVCVQDKKSDYNGFWGGP